MRKILVVLIMLLAGCTPLQYMEIVHPEAVQEAEEVGAPLEEVAPKRWGEAVAYSEWKTSVQERRLHPFLTCTRYHESDRGPYPHTNGYGAVSASGTYRGAYQFHQRTWNSTAVHAGRPELVGVDPARAMWWDQDELALALYRWQGASPWLGRCAGR